MANPTPESTHEPDEIDAPAPDAGIADAVTTTRLMVLMFTDLVDSSALKVELGDAAYVEQIAQPHNALFREILARFPGAEENNYTGDGYLATFESVADAVNAALLFHHALRTHAWQRGRPTTRIGIHLGDTTVFSGSELNQQLVASQAADMCARLMSLGVGGQTLLTRHAFDSARQNVRAHPDVAGEVQPEIQWLAHGRYLFKGNDDPMEVFEVGAFGSAPLTPPEDGEKAKRATSIEEEATLGWRPAKALTIPGRSSWVLERKLGEGGFGEVWLAANQRTKEQRVFKFCFDPDRLRSFKREITLFRLIRAGLGERDEIVPLLDVQVDEVPYFLESQYISGGNLRQWADRQGGLQAVPLETRLKLLIGIARAVAAAHSLGIIHKDIKPSNIFIEEGEGGAPKPKLADFGIGVLTDRALLANHQVTETGFTETLGLGNDSSRTGTRLYAPPEAQIGKPASTAGDLYSLGVMLYQFVIGDLTRPLGVGWEADIPDSLLRQDIAACTHRDPESRLGSATELIDRIHDLEVRRDDLRAQQASATAQKRAEEIVKSAPRLAAFSSFAVIVTASVVGYFVYHAAVDELISHERADLRDETALRAHEFRSTIAALRTDLQTLAASISNTVDEIARVRQDSPGIDGDRVAANSLRTEDELRHLLEAEFIAFCETVEHQPYFQVRLISASSGTTDPEFGRELVRVNRNDDGFSFSPVELDELDSGAQYWKADHDYFLQSLQLGAQEVYLSTIGLNREAGVTEVIELRPTLRASVPVRDAAGNLFGALVINLDLAPVFDAYLESSRHLTFLTDDAGNFLVHPDPRFEFAWEKRVATGLAEHYPDPEEQLTLHSEELLWDELEQFYDDRFDRYDVAAQTGFNLTGSVASTEPGVLPLGYPFLLKRLRLTGQWDDDGWARLDEKLYELRAVSTHQMSIPAAVQVMATHSFSLSAPLDDAEALSELMQIENEIVYWSQRELQDLPGSPGIELLYTEPCSQFYASFVRLDYDPQNPERFLGLVMAVSQDELYADLRDTKFNAIQSVACLAATAAPAAFIFSYLLARMPSFSFRRRSRNAARGSIG